MIKLAIEGGEPIRRLPFPPPPPIGEEERRAVLEVLDSGVLSQFVGQWGPGFFGGPRVRALESAWCEYFGVRHAVSMNSATSALYAAVGAAGVEPGDEVIVSPYTMSASAAAAVVSGAVPVFADIEAETFCLDPESVAGHLTERTRAIIGVDLFGHPAAWDRLREVVHGCEIVLIEDAAQAPGARERGRYAGTLGDIGVFSLNYHKTIHCGEGGIAVTDDPALAERLQLIRNHGEAVVRAKGTARPETIVGFNYRMTEIEAAIALEQLKKLERLLAPRIAAAEALTERLGSIPGITPPVVRDQVRHGYYVYPIRFDAEAMGCTRAWFAEALRAEGIPIEVGYVEPLYRQPLYRGMSCSCPVAERMHGAELLYLTTIHAGIGEGDLRDVLDGFDKVAAGASRGALV
jgi:dTDP-4-amino-4,6-dideoxygalactose transaminase